MKTRYHVNAGAPVEVFDFDDKWLTGFLNLRYYVFCNICMYAQLNGESCHNPDCSNDNTIPSELLTNKVKFLNYGRK